MMEVLQGIRSDWVAFKVSLRIVRRMLEGEPPPPVVPLLQCMTCGLSFVPPKLDSSCGHPSSKWILIGPYNDDLECGKCGAIRCASESEWHLPYVYTCPKCTWMLQ